MWGIKRWSKAKRNRNVGRVLRKKHKTNIRQKNEKYFTVKEPKWKFVGGAASEAIT